MHSDYILQGADGQVKDRILAPNPAEREARQRLRQAILRRFNVTRVADLPREGLLELDHALRRRIVGPSVAWRACI